MDKIKNLNKKLDYIFKDTTLLEAALSHRSMGKQNYERLEFLGDSVLNFVIAAEIFKRYPKAKEGELSRLRASLVNRDSLVLLAKSFSLGDYLHLGVGELKSGGVHRESILADAMEAIIGAIYVDSDLATCQAHILQWFAPRFSDLTLAVIPKDFKTQLQEFLQAKHLRLPQYTALATLGSERAPIFQVACEVADFEKKVIGTGSNRRKAEQDAAEKMLLALVDLKQN